MPRRRPVELHINHERWLVSYSDFVTLLFAFFVVMYSVSQVNESKYRVLSETLVRAFDHNPQQSLSPIQVGNPSLSPEPSAIDLAQIHKDSQSGDGAFEKTADLPQLADQFSDRFSDLINDQLVKVNSNEFWLQIELQANILFPSASATPSLQAHAIFEEIAGMLKDFANPVQVEGFTDNVPISNRRYASNWELSGARATQVVKLLIKGGVLPQRLSAVGYGEYQPVADNSTEAGRTQNRRVVLMVAREKLNRPKVKEVEAIERALAPVERAVEQPYPQPGLERAEPEKQDAVVGSVQDVQFDQRDPKSITPERQPKVGSTKPVELKNGGLLFSSDPQLPRDNPEISE